MSQRHDHLPAAFSQRLERSIDIVRYLPWMAGIVWRATRYWALAWFALLILQGGLPVALVKLTQITVDSLLAAVGAEPS